MNNYVFVDCEAYGGSPATGALTEVGAVVYGTKETFYTDVREEGLKAAFTRFDAWLAEKVKGRPVFWSDNVAFDWQWINDGFWRTLGRNPFGHSGRRISDFYAGVTGKVGNTQRWKGWRRTKHTHHPVDDAMGNVEAFEAIMEMLHEKASREVK